jgi:hypothetical protein
MGKITDERFCEMSRDYERDNAELKARVCDLQNATVSYWNSIDNSRHFTTLIRKYFDVETLDAPMLNELVSKLEVPERETSNGERTQKSTFTTTLWVF